MAIVLPPLRPISGFTPLRSVEMRSSILVIFLASFLLEACQDQETISPTSIGRIQSRRRTGLIRSSPERLAKISVAGKSGFTGKIPPQFSLNMPPPEPVGQANEGACVAWAVAYAARSFYQSQNFIHANGKVDYGAVFSPEYVYNQTKISADCEKGSYFISSDKHTGALDLLVNQGVCLWKDMPYSDVSCALLPNATQKDIAANYRIKAYAKVEGFTSIDLKKLLLKHPIIIGATVDEGFLNADAKYIWKSPSGAKIGSHAMVLIGFDDAKNAFKILNSWSTNWGNQGYSWLDYNYYTQVVFESYVLSL